MRLNELLRDGDAAAAAHPAPAYNPELNQIEITGITADSRAVQPGFLFAALPGSKTDGSKFIADALAKGAVAILTAPANDRGAPPKKHIYDVNPRRRLALMAASFFKYQPRVVVGVTGTNGKTSVAAYTQQIWTRLGERAGSLGTLGIHAPGFEVKGSLTTPDPVTLHRDLGQLAGRGIDHVAMEASSHGLDQFRLDGVRFRAAGFTNLTRDHLDYHVTLENYRRAKLRLFAEVMAPGGVAVLNADSPEFEEFRGACRARRHAVIPYGMAAPRDDGLRIEKSEPLADGLRLAFTWRGRPYETHLHLAGTFQAWNVLCALGLAVGGGSDADTAAATLPNLQGAPGRMQRVGNAANGAPIYVDYAHTPDALETVLKALRPHAKGKLVVVFGCGGDRDRGKRPLMGGIAVRLADRVYVTDDNPRSEKADAIRKEIMSAATGATEIGDRAEAIFAAVKSLRADDLLVVAGKGHEQGQIVGDKTFPFDDVDVARRAVAELGGRA
ncbi:MAG: UDP-N-acetylmuramoyl-L-alanyl-D-glutamate--2,6-diaminopimelate ligase [Alphaproteobacteria bacterium]